MKVISSGAKIIAMDTYLHTSKLIHITRLPISFCKTEGCENDCLSGFQLMESMRCFWGFFGMKYSFCLIEMDPDFYFTLLKYPKLTFQFGLLLTYFILHSRFVA